MDLIEDDELLGVVGEVQSRLGNASAVRVGLQVQVDRRSSLGDRQRKRGLAGLPRAEEGDSRCVIQQGGDFRGHPASNAHPGKNGSTCCAASAYHAVAPVCSEAK